MNNEENRRRIEQDEVRGHAKGDALVHGCDEANYGERGDNDDLTLGQWDSSRQEAWHSTLSTAEGGDRGGVVQAGAV
eukprot:11942690-Heterocapsa_arctica.AAC.1